MSSATTSLMKPLSMAESCCLTSIPTLFSNKTPNSFLSLPSSKPIKLSHLSYASPSSFHSWVLLRKKNSAFNIVPLVAQTSDWAQEEEEKEQQGLNWENQEEESGEDETEGQIAASASGDENWEGEGEVGDGAEELYPDPPEEAKLFVGNLPYDIDSEALAQLFNQAGIVEIAEVIYNRETDQSRGFGFVTMSTVEEAEKAVDMFHRYDINGRFLTVNKAAPRGERPERTPRTFETSYRVYVGNLPWQVDNARLEQVFSEHGKVVDARVVYDRETQRSRGFGFVTMSSETELQDAIAALDGQSLDGRAIRVNVAEERPRRSSF